MLCVWLSTDMNMVDMYMKYVSPHVYSHYQYTIVCDDNDNDNESHKYLYKLLDTLHITIPGRVLELAMVKLGVGSQVTPRHYELPQTSMENIV